MADDGPVAGGSLTARLRAVSTTTLCDADAGVRVAAGLFAVNPATAAAGPARTVLASGDLIPVLRGLEALEPGDVLVVDAGGAALAVAGELFATHAQNAGAAALVVDGYVRDVASLRQLTMPVFARGVVPRASRAMQWGTVQVPISCGGIPVAPGDLVVVDADGVVVTTAEHAAAIIDRAEEIESAEQRIHAGLLGGASLFSMLNFDEVRTALQDGRDHPLQLRPPSP